MHLQFVLSARERAGKKGNHLFDVDEAVLQYTRLNLAQSLHSCHRQFYRYTLSKADLKPANVLISTVERLSEVKTGDLGLGKK